LKRAHRISYRKISDYTGLRLADISKGLQILMISDFLRVAPYGDEAGHHYNIYMLQGDFVGKRRRMRPKSRQPNI
jgi:hypothetical protein